jgi:hypothetical protein
MTRATLRPAVRIAIVVLALVLGGEGGHLLFERMGWEAGHHAFHLAYGAGAIAAFVAFAIRDIRRHGPPRLAWALRTVPETRSGVAD